MIALLTVAASVGLYADDTPRNTGPEFGKAGPFGLLVVVLLLLGTLLLIRSMNRHLGRLPDSFDPDHPGPDQAADEGTIDVGPLTNTDAEEQDGPPHAPG